jgi:hypothetical protein
MVTGSPILADDEMDSMSPHVALSALLTDDMEAGNLLLSLTHWATDADWFPTLADDEWDVINLVHHATSDDESDVQLCPNEPSGTDSSMKWTAADFAGFPDPDTFLGEDGLSDDDFSDD